MKEFDDFETEVQCEEYWDEEILDNKELHGRQHRTHTRKGFLSGAALSKFKSDLKRKTIEKARTASRMLSLKRRSGQLRKRDRDTGE